MELTQQDVQNLISIVSNVTVKVHEAPTLLNLQNKLHALLQALQPSNEKEQV